MFAHQDWRGNIRELENLVARYSILGSLDAVKTIAPRTFSMPQLNISLGGAISLKHIAKQAIREMESNVILKVLRENKWNRRKAAQVLNISYRALIYKIQEAGLSSKNTRKGSRLARIPAENPTSIPE
jgi:DNA-binding NtrC family response regulator